MSQFREKLIISAFCLLLGACLALSINSYTVAQDITTNTEQTQEEESDGPFDELEGVLDYLVESFLDLIFGD